MLENALEDWPASRPCRAAIQRRRRCTSSSRWRDCSVPS
jgi:hypothetical protein